MSMIKSKNTKPEVLIHRELLLRKISHEMHPKIHGSPDIVIGKCAIFVDGCFWHRCPKCFRMPETNREYWERKIQLNTERDIKNIKLLESAGYKVLSIWEHEIKASPSMATERILNERLFKY